ncbi:redoxin domain-containing protein [Fimbriiglobus ruber]|uniref:Thioredoxin domain-containing protein n=1 Tax=Fimbriiglobus ruber TaxID=1908690 RepID=A0A225D0V5_9BACT|nr:redoxin domain-containing protein [Fimbriiglobus ruber]OWK35132.1 hypothetical protein FRUB_09974 [Fimbriiglobus ruber]
MNKLSGVLFCILLLGNGASAVEEPGDLSKPQPAPELVKVSDWINTKPVRLADLKGRVVVVHFWTRGCINCAHNYPHYRKWTTAYKDKNVTILGIHTPEFEGEKSADAIRKAMKEHHLTFPVAVDNEGANWSAWRNRYWPCVYVVDKKGIVKYRWEGELGEKGEAWVRERIDTLLADEKKD